MAKENKVGVDDIFAKLIAEQNSISPGAAIAGDEMFSAVKMWIPTGSTILDTIIANKPDGGWPAGRTVEIYGQESIGKSTLVFSGLANVQKMGGIAMYFDVEQAGSQEMMENNGVDLSRLIVSKLTSIEEIFKVLEKNLQTIINTKSYKDKPVLVCMDSLAQMTTDAELEADYDFNMNINLKKAVQIGKALRKITPYLNEANACLIIINQLRDAPGVTYGDPTTTPGGKALKFAASVRIKLMGKTPVRVLDPITQEIYDNAVEEWYNECEVWKENGGGKTGAKKPAKPKKTDFKGSEVTVGNDVTATLVKNKVGPPHREAEFRIIFTEGIIEEEAWFDYATKFKIIENENAFTYKFSEKSKIVFENELGPILFKRDEWLENVMVDVDIREQVKNQIVKMLTQSTKGAKAAPVKLGEEDEE